MLTVIARHLVVAVHYFCWWFIIKSVRGEHAFKVSWTGWDMVSCEGWNNVPTVGGETTESSKHFITWAPHLMKYCHVRHLLLWTLNHPWSHLEVRFPACVSKDIFYGLLFYFPTWELDLVILHSTCVLYSACKQMMCYSWLLGQVSVTTLFR